MLSPDKQQELLDSVVEDFTARLRQGERPGIQEYSNKHPGMSEEIEELLTSVAMIEELKTQSNSSSDSLKREMKEIMRLDRIGDYRIVRELGRGGMGVVFEAVHESLGRRVAIKVMPNRTFDDEKYLERFRREAHAAANLHHTNIVSVFGIGQTGEHHYYVMEFVDGKSLSAILASLNGLHESLTHDGVNTETVPAQGYRPSSIKNTLPDPNRHTVPVSNRFIGSKKIRYRWAAQIGAQIADGLAYAHALGTLHRDVKPSNLLVDKNETVWLTDFGLVKHIGNQSITKTGDIIGTPQYMAPESFEGQYDERSETYCLGLSLYEMVTLHPAYENATTPELIRRITTTSPVPPRKLDKKIPIDLNRIIQKSISREPNYRYQTAAEMRDDLRAYLDDRPISARRISMTENMWRWSKRNPLPAALSALTALLICSIAIGATVALRINNRALIVAQEKETSLAVEKRVVDHMRGKAEETIDFTVDSFDNMFRSLVFKGKSDPKDLTLNGFNDLMGVSTTINESDAEFLDQMLKLYTEFAEKNEHNTKLMKLTANSHRRVANIYQLTGEFAKAVDAYQQAIDVYRKIQAPGQDGDFLTLDLVRTINERGRAFELQDAAKSRANAVEEYSRAIDLLRNHEASDSSLFKAELAKTLILLGTPPFRYRPDIPERFEEIRSWDSTGWFMNRKYENARNRTKPAYRTADAQAAKAALNEAHEIADDLIRAESSNHDYQLIKAIALSRLATFQFATKHVKAGLNSLSESEELLKKLRKQDPNNPGFQFALAQNYAVNRPAKQDLGIRSLGKSKGILLELVEKHDRNLDYKRFLADVCLRLGVANKEKGKAIPAERNMELANTTLQSLIPITPRSRQVQLSGVVCLMQYVDLLMDNGRADMAIEEIEVALEKLSQSRKDRSNQIPRFVFNRRNNLLYSVLALVHKEQGDFNQALVARKQANHFLELSARQNARNRMNLIQKPGDGASGANVVTEKSAVAPD